MKPLNYNEKAVFLFNYNPYIIIIKKSARFQKIPFSLTLSRLNEMNS